MATKAEILKAREKWKQHCETVQAATVANINETAEQRLARLRRLLLNYSDFVDYYFPTGPKTPKQGSRRPAPRSTSTPPTKSKKTVTSRLVLSGTVALQNLPTWTCLSPCGLWRGIFSVLRFSALPKSRGAKLNVMVLVGKSEDNAKTCSATFRPNYSTTSVILPISANSTTPDPGKRASL